MILVYRRTRCVACGDAHTLYNPDPLAHDLTAAFRYDCPASGILVVLRPPASFEFATEPPSDAVPLRWLQW